MSQARAPRFKRIPNPPAINLTQRDIDVLCYVAEYRLIQADQLAKLDKGSARTLGRRLYLLFHHGYLDRPRAQKRLMYESAGPVPLVYALGTKGARLLNQMGLLENNPGHWTTKNKALKDMFLEHRLGITDVLVRFQTAMHPRWRFIGEGALRTELKKDNLSHSPFAWQVVLSHKGMPWPISIVPDGTFALEERRTGNRIYYFLEYDRGSMPISRKDFRQTSMARKIAGYLDTWERGVIKEAFGFYRFRVLTITSSEKRLEGLVQAAKHMCTDGGAGLFLFTSQDNFSAMGEPLKGEYFCPKMPGKDKLMG